MDLVRTPLLLERARPSVSMTGRHNPRTISGKRREHLQRSHDQRRPKSRTRNISLRKKLGSTRRDAYSRIERRTRDRATPQHREVARGIATIRRTRRRGEKPLLPGRPSPRNVLLKGHRL